MTTTAPPMLPLALLEGSMARPKRNKGYTPPPDMPYIGTDEAAEIMGVSETIIKRMAKERDIQSAYKIQNRFWIMLRSEIETLAKKRRD